MTHWCDSCGQRLPDGEAPSDATWLGVPDQAHQHTFAKPGATRKSGRDKKFVGLFVAVLAVWGLFVGLGRIVSPDDTIDERAAADIEEARIERLTKQAEQSARAEFEAARAELDAAEAQDEVAEAEPATIADVAGDYGAADAAPGFPDAAQVEASDGRTRPTASVQVEQLRGEMARRDRTAVVAYRSGLGVVLVDLREGNAVVAADASNISSAIPGSELLRAGPATYAVDPTTLAVSRVGEGSSLVLSDALDGNTYFVDAKSLAGQASILEVVAAGEYGFHRMPDGDFQLQPADGLGVLAVPTAPTGATLIARAKDFTQLSENRVLTGTAQAILEQTCATELNCTLAITQLEAGEQTQVPASFARFGDRYVLAPNGDMLLRYSPEGFAELFEVRNAVALPVDAGLRAAAWSPNSDFLVWLDLIGDPRLKVMFTDDRQVVAIDLQDLGAPPPSTPDLIVFTPTPSDS